MNQKHPPAFDAILAHYHKGEFQAVVALGEKLARQYPGAIGLCYLMATANTGLNRPEQTLIWLDRALALRPDTVEAHIDRGKVLGALGRSDEAVAAFRRALELQPANADAHYSLGVTLERLDDKDRALQSFRAAVAAKPEFGEAQNNLGALLLEAGQAEEALIHLTRATELMPGAAKPHMQRAQGLRKLERYPEAIVALTRVLKIDPDHEDARCERIYLMSFICDWEGLALEADAIPKLKGKQVGPLIFCPLEDAPERHRARAEAFVKGFRPITVTPLPPRQPHDKIRLGYVSADFNDHAVMQVLPRLLELHDRSRFEVHAFSVGRPSDDPFRHRAMAAVDHFHDLHKLSEEEITARAREAGIDIAINLMGYTNNAMNGIFVGRAAPVQINFLGYPGTLGGDFMDYIIADAIAIPDAERAHYSESLIRLPVSFMPVDDSRPVAEGLTRAAFGLPEKGFVFASFNNNYKYAAESFAIWMRLLKQVEGSVLWLRHMNSWAEAHLKRFAVRRGVDPARLIMTKPVPTDEHLGRHRLADLFLDTFDYNAHSSAIDALWGGLPVLTRAGRGMPSRVAASILHAANLPELVTQTSEEYERLALELATDPARLAAIKAKLAAARVTAPLFDCAAHARNMERAYEEVWRRHLASEAPADITL